MLTRQARVEYGWIVYLLSVGWCAAVAAQGLNFPYKVTVSEPNAAFEIENTYQLTPGKPKVPGGATASEQALAILGRYSSTAQIIIKGTNEKTTLRYENIGKLGGYDFGVAGICDTKDGYGIRAENTAIGGTGLYVKGGSQGSAAMFDGSVVASKSISLCNAGTATNAWSDGLIIGDNKRGIFGILGTQGSYRLGLTWNGYRHAYPADSNDWEVIGVNGSDTTAEIMMGDDGISLCVEDGKVDGVGAEPAVRMKIRPDGNVGIGTANPTRTLDVNGDIQVNGPIQVQGGYDIVLKAQSNDPGDIIFQRSDGTQKARIWSEWNKPTGLFLSSGDNDPDLTINPDGNVEIKGNLKIVSRTSGQPLIEFGEGLDYAEGFDVSDNMNVGPGAVLVIDPQNPGNLTVSTTAYDTKVAGIVAGAKGLGSGVRLGTGQSDHDVALAGRVYCNVDATESAVEPGDLMTTSATAGHAMKVSDHLRAQGAILGKAMERLEKGQRAQILVLVTLQ